MAVFDIDGLQTVLSRYDPVEVRQAFCVRERSAVATCNACVRLCPREAISFSPSLNIDFNLCDGCGACVSLCPTGVYSLKGTTDLSLLRIVRERLGATRDVSFHCVMASRDRAHGLKQPMFAGIGLADDKTADLTPPPTLSTPPEAPAAEAPAAEPGAEASAAEAPVAEADAGSGATSSATSVAPSNAPSEAPYYLAPDHPGAIRVPCIARVDDAVLIAAVANGSATVWMDAGPCAECWRATALEVAEESTRHARGVLRLFALDDRVIISADAPEPFREAVEAARAALEAQAEASEIGDAPNSRGAGNKGVFGKGARASAASPGAPAVKGAAVDGEAVSRRAFFSGIKNNAMQTGVNIIDTKVQQWKTEDTPDGLSEPSGLDRRLPPRHALMVHAMRALRSALGPCKVESIPSDDVAFGQPAVASACTFCGVCEDFCPTEAIAVVKRPSGDKLVGSLPSLCVDCGLCADICPPQVISFDETIDVPTLVEGRIQRLVAGETAKCKECKQEYFAVDGAEYCVYCEMRRRKHGDEFFGH